MGKGLVYSCDDLVPIIFRHMFEDMLEFLETKQLILLPKLVHGNK